MKCAAFVILACTLWGANGFPYHYYGNRDSLSYGPRNHGLAQSGYYTPHNNPHLQSQNYQASRYYQPDRRRQATLEEAYVPQQNEGFYPQATEELLTPKPIEIADPLPTDKVEIPTTIKALLPELVEPEIEEVEQPKETKNITPEPKKNATKNKQIKKPVDEEDEEEEEEEYAPKMPKGAFFPMFFGWGGSRSSGGAPNGATAIANAFSTGRKGVATSHATAYGPPHPEYKSN